MTKKTKMKLSATYGKNGRPELQAVPRILVIVAAPVMAVEPGEPINVGPTENCSHCGRCQYMKRHTGNA